MSTYAVKWLENILGTRFFPITHVKAVRDDNNVNVETLLAAKQATLVSGANIKTINGNSILGSGNLDVSGGGGGGQANVIESISVNGVAQAVDENKNVDITVPDDLADLNDDSTHRVVTDSEKSTWNSKGTYSKPSGGIPATDLASGVQTSLGLADTALQSFTETDPVFSASAAAEITSTDITNWNNKTSNTGTVTSVRVQATSPVVSSQNTAQSSTLNTTISLADGYGDTKNPFASKTAGYVLAAPASANGAPSFRALAASDIPDLSSTYLTSETDPTVPAWAKETDKPSYTASEVGAVPTTRTVNSKALSSDITLSASDVSAVPTTRTVNGKALSADITLSASDVSALPSSTAIPSKTSDLTNDSGYITSADISGVYKYKGSKTNYSQLPSTGNVTGDVWNVVNAYSTYPAGTNFAWDGTTWDALGGSVDLSGYVPTSRTVNGKALSSNITLSASDVSALPSSTSIPSKTSDLTNDSGFITINDVPEGSVASTTTPLMDGTAAVGTETAFARGDHRHPTDTTRQAEITSSNKLSADLISDGTTNKTVTATEKSTWSGKQDALTFDGTYNASTNKAATVSTVTNAINALDGGTIGTGGTGKTITSLSQSNGNVSATFSDISITKSQVSDFPSTMTPSSHTHGNISNTGTLTDTAAAAAGNDYVVIRDADNDKIQTSTIKGTDVADAVSKKHSHSTLTLSTTAQAYDGTNTLALPSSDPYTSARTPSAHNQASNTINAMTGYSKGSSSAAVAATDSLNTAISKLENQIDAKTSNTGTITSVKMNGTTVSSSGEADLGTVITSHQDISGKANKSEMSVTAGTGTNADKTTITLKTGTSATVLVSHQDISGKADKATTLAGYGITDAASSTDLASYLPLAGGTMTGTIKLPAGTGLEYSTGAGLLAYHPTNWGGTTNTQWCVGSLDSQGVIRSSNANLLHYNDGDGQSYAILDAKNYSSYALPLTGGSVSGEVIVSDNIKTSGDIYLDNNKYVRGKNTSDTNVNILGVDNNNNVLVGYGNTASPTYIYGNSIRLLYGTSRTTGLTLSSSGNVTVAGYVAVGTGGSDSYLASDSATNIYLKNSSGAVLVCDGKVIRRSTASTMADVTLGSATYPWGGIYSTSGNFSDHIYLANNKYLYIADSGGTNRNVLYCSTGNNLFIGYDIAGAGKSTYIDGNVIYFRYGTSHGTAAYINSSGNVGIGTTSPSTKLHVSGVVKCTSVDTSSDETLKSKVGDITIKVEDIAAAPNITFTWKEGEDKKSLHGGTTAQYWEKVTPYYVHGEEGDKSLEYGSLAVSCSIELAKEVVALKKENAMLKKELAEIKEMISKLNK